MASRCLRFLTKFQCSIKTTKQCFNVNISRQNFLSTTSFTVNNKLEANKKFRTESNVTYLDDPDTFGTLSRKTVNENILQDEGDIKEEKYLQELPLPSQKLTTRQYADIIKQYLKHKRLKEAIDVLEVRMLQEDRVKPENYIYNILIGACADVGYTKKAFRLYNDMKKRALKPTGDTYTCLFTACLNSPWVADGLQRATNLRALMIEKRIEPNLTNYNVMIKTFGRCGDLPTAFKIVDEMISKKIKIRVHTFNHLLHACITDKENGLRYALIVWRKMLKMREKPNIHSFNLMLKCVKDCNLGSKQDIADLLGILGENMIMSIGNSNKPIEISANSGDVSATAKQKLIGTSSYINNVENTSETGGHKNDDTVKSVTTDDNYDKLQFTEDRARSQKNHDKDEHLPIAKNEVSLVDHQDEIRIELVDLKKNVPQVPIERTVPNLLSKTLQMEKVFALQDVNKIQDKFAIIGGQDDFLKEMEVYLVKPDIKTFTQMLPLIDESSEAEMKLLEAMKLAKVKPDIDFYNLLIRKRCLRFDYDKAIEVRDMIEKDRKKRHPLNKKIRLKENIMTYGVLALTCRNKESAEKLLDEMKEKKIKVNIQILGTLLKHGSVNMQFDYIKYIMNVIKEEKVMLNDAFIQHLEAFNNQCAKIVEQNEKKGILNKFNIAYQHFLKVYKQWLTDVNAEEALKKEHPWQQFREPYPETVQRQCFTIKQPKKFYKRNRKFVKYIPRVK